VLLNPVRYKWQDIKKRGPWAASFLFKLLGSLQAASACCAAWRRSDSSRDRATVSRILCHKAIKDLRQQLVGVQCRAQLNTSRHSGRGPTAICFWTFAVFLVIGASRRPNAAVPQLAKVCGPRLPCFIVKRQCPSEIFPSRRPFYYSWLLSFRP